MPDRRRVSFVIDSILAAKPVPATVFIMQTATELKLAAFEKKLTELSGLSKEIKRLDKQVTELRKKIESPKDWRLMVGRLPDTKMNREAVALGREIRRKQTKP